MKQDPAELKKFLVKLKNEIEEFYQNIKIEELQEERAELEKQTLIAGFWDNMEKATAVNQQISNLKKKTEPWINLKTEITDYVDLFDLALEEKDEETLSDLEDSFFTSQKLFLELQTLELLAGDDDKNNCYVTIHPGAGGTESQDWAQMLMRMYLRWAETKNFKYETIDYQNGEEAGIKSVTFLVKGEYAYGFLKSEAGVHRLVRISPFDANKRRHTSFASLEVVPEMPDNIEIEIKESDLRIDTYHSSGAGGQHVNTSDSAVRITHLPTGVIVQCQNERSQTKNKASALKVLKARLYKLKKAEMDELKNEKTGEKKEISWGNQIRSYVFQPYTLVKDHRTNEETGNIEAVMDGQIDRFIEAYLKKVLN